MEPTTDTQTDVDLLAMLEILLLTPQLAEDQTEKLEKMADNVRARLDKTQGGS